MTTQSLLCNVAPSAGGKYARKKTAPTGDKPVAEPQDPDQGRPGEDVSRGRTARKAVVEKSNDSVSAFIDTATEIEKLNGIFATGAVDFGVPGSETLERNVSDAVFRAAAPTGNPTAAEPAIAIKHQHWTSVAHR